jgi:hypothetical protein
MAVTLPSGLTRGDGFRQVATDERRTPALADRLDRATRHAEPPPQPGPRRTTEAFLSKKATGRPS